MDKRKGIRSDFSGITIGSMTILNPTNEMGSSGRFFIGVCKCGKKAKVSSRSIRRSMNDDYNLSCRKCIYSDRKVGMSPDDIAFNNLYSMYKSGAVRTRSIEFNLSVDFFRKITKEYCYYCGSEPKQICYNSIRTGKYIYNGIDRVNPKLGYIESNCLPACGDCNIMKQSMQYDEFISKIKQIYLNICD